jgi:hypothetical protein
MDNEGLLFLFESLKVTHLTSFGPNFTCVVYKKYPNCVANCIRADANYSGKGTTQPALADSSTTAWMFHWQIYSCM